MKQLICSVDRRTANLFSDGILAFLTTKDGVSFHDHILLSPFIPEPSGQIGAVQAIQGYSKVFTISYKVVQGYMLTWVID